MERKLASIQQIEEVQSIPNADNLVKYRINGWWVVDRKEIYKVGDTVVYLEVDSWVPTELAPFLTKGKDPKEFNGIKGERLRTIKLRGVLSQGLLLPITCHSTLHSVEKSVGLDVTDILGIQKWEQPIPTTLAGQMKGNFPSFIRKTDQERIQNLPLHSLVGQKFEVTEKLDGSSMTIYHNNGIWGVCSRNIDLKLDQEGNSFIDMFNKLKPKLLGITSNIAIQGELVGGKIQGNPYNLSEFKFYVFSVFDINNQVYLSPNEVKTVTKTYELDYIPYLYDFTVTEETTKQELLNIAEGKSVLNENTEREGLVFKSYVTRDSFKCISNIWLLKND